MLSLRGYSRREAVRHVFKEYGSQWKVSMAEFEHLFFTPHKGMRTNFSKLFERKSASQKFESFGIWLNQNRKLARRMVELHKKPAFQASINWKQAERLAGRRSRVP